MSLKEIRADIKEMNAKLDLLIEHSIEIRNIKAAQSATDARLNTLQNQLTGLAVMTIGGGIIAGFIAAVNKHLI